MLGALNGIENIIEPLSTPLLTTPFEYASDVPVTGLILIQKGCPIELILNLYVKPLSKFNVGFDISSIM